MHTYAPSVEETTRPEQTQSNALPREFVPVELALPAGFEQRFPEDDLTLNNLSQKLQQTRIMDPELAAAMLQGGGSLLSWPVPVMPKSR